MTMYKDRIRLKGIYTFANFTHFLSTNKKIKNDTNLSCSVASVHWGHRRIHYNTHTHTE